jgi:hypothetical protein
VHTHEPRALQARTYATAPRGAFDWRVCGLAGLTERDEDERGDASSELTSNRWRARAAAASLRLQSQQDDLPDRVGSGVPRLSSHVETSPWPSEKLRLPAVEVAISPGANSQSIKCSFAVIKGQGARG